MPHIIGSTTSHHGIGGDGRIHGRSAAPRHLRAACEARVWLVAAMPTLRNHHGAGLRPLLSGDLSG